MEILKINPNKIIESDIKKIADFLKSGKVLVLPTDTVYGLMAGYQNKKAVEKIFKIKKRNKKKLLSVFVSSIVLIKKITRISKQQEEILKKIWPGKITVVFSRKNGGIRIPNYPFLLEILRKTGPLVQTSANISNEPATCKINEVIKSFEKRKIQPDIIVDAGNLKKSQPSMVIDLSEEKIKILRKGGKKEEIILKLLR